MNFYSNNRRIPPDGPGFGSGSAGRTGRPKWRQLGEFLPSYFAFVYREGDIVKQPMKKGSFVPKNVPGVGWGGVGWVGHEGVGWGGS